MGTPVSQDGGCSLYGHSLRLVSDNEQRTCLVPLVFGADSAGHMNAGLLHPYIAVIAVGDEFDERLLHRGKALGVDIYYALINRDRADCHADYLAYLSLSAGPNSVPPFTIIHMNMRRFEQATQPHRCVRTLPLSVRSAGRVHIPQCRRRNCTSLLHRHLQPARPHASSWRWCLGGLAMPQRDRAKQQQDRRIDQVTEIVKSAAQASRVIENSKREIRRARELIRTDDDEPPPRLAPHAMSS